jgi:hypothetical protein
MPKRNMKLVSGTNPTNTDGFKNLYEYVGASPAVIEYTSWSSIVDNSCAGISETSSGFGTR